MENKGTRVKWIFSGFNMYIIGSNKEGLPKEVSSNIDSLPVDVRSAIYCRILENPTESVETIRLMSDINNLEYSISYKAPVKIWINFKKSNTEDLEKIGINPNKEIKENILKGVTTNTFYHKKKERELVL